MKNTCPHCGHVEVVYMHKLNKALLGAFHRLCLEFTRTACPVPVKKFPALGMSHNQQANFQKLRYFGLVTNADREGWWAPTKSGLNFWRGQEMCLNRVATISKRVLDITDPFWDTVSVKPRWVFVGEDCDPNYKQRSEYREEKRQQTSLEDYL